MCKDPSGHLCSIYTIDRNVLVDLIPTLCYTGWHNSLYMVKDQVGWEARLNIISTKNIGVHICGLHPCVLVIV